MYRMSFRKSMPPCSNSLNSFDFAMHHQFRKSHHVQIIETASILYVQWAYSTMTSLYVLLLARLTARHNYSYCELSDM